MFKIAKEASSLAMVRLQNQIDTILFRGPSHCFKNAKIAQGLKFLLASKQRSSVASHFRCNGRSESLQCFEFKMLNKYLNESFTF